MELISTLKSEINLKKEQFEREIELLSGLSECIENKTEFSKVWHTLLKCDIVNTDLARELVAYYFNMPLDTISVTPGRIIIKFNKKILKMAPLHHHFEQCGWEEKDIVKLFYVVGLLLAMAAITYGVWL